MNTGARVTYAMGKDREAPEHFGMLHGKNLTPHRAIWTLAIISAVIGCIAVATAFGDAGAPTDAAIRALPHGFWSSFGYTTHDKMAALPNSLLAITLASNFGTFLLYGMSCLICMVAYHRHPKFSVLRHMLIPIFGLLANLACMVFYLVGPFHGLRHQGGAAAGVGRSFGLGHLRRHLLCPHEQGHWANDAGRSQADDELMSVGSPPGAGASPPIFCNRSAKVKLNQ